MHTARASQPRRRTALAASALSLILLVGLLSACESSAELTLEESVVEDLSQADIVVVNGASNEAEVATVLPEPVTVQVVSSDGSPLPGVGVEWVFASGRGAAAGQGSGPMASSLVSYTDSDGRTQAVWELGTQAGNQQATAQVILDGPPSAGQNQSQRSRGRSVRFSAEARPGPVSSIVVDPGQATVRPGETVDLDATASDRFGNNTPDADLTWASSDEAIARVDTAGSVAALSTGSVVITARSASVEGTATLNSISDGPSEFTVAAGQSQEGTAGRPVPVEPTVVVRDPQGEPVAGVTVSWGVRTGGGSVSSTTATTDQNGQASMAWTLGTTAGVNTLAASVAGLPELVFQATGRAGQVAQVGVSPSGLQLSPGQTAQLSAAAQDEYGNAVPGASATWSVDDGAIASVSGNGLLTALAAGSVVVQATVDGVSGSTSVEVVSQVTTPSSVALVSGSGQTGQAGVTLSAQPTVRVQDTAGDPVAGVAVTWTVTSGGGSVSSQSTATGQDGAASVAWTLGGAIGGQTLRAEVDGLAPVNFTATATAGPVARLELSPASAAVQVGDSVRFEAAGFDEFGNPVAGLTPTWSISPAGIATVTSDGVVTGLTEGGATVQAAVGAISGTAALTVQPLPAPSGVTDLSAAVVTDSSITLQWTEVDDGTGNPANYALRYSEGTLSWAGAAATERVIPGSAIGQTTSFTWEGLDAETTYEFQLVSYRETLNVNAVFGPQSNVASATTSARTLPPGAYVEASQESVAFTALGQTSDVSAVVRDASGNPLSGYSFSFASLNPSVVEVTDMGRLTAVGVGATAIVLSTLCCAGSDTISVSVDQIPALLELSQDSIATTVGSSAQLQTAVRDENGNPIPGLTISVTSSNPSVVSAADQGNGVILIQALAEGTAQVQASVAGLSASTIVAVAQESANPDRIDNPNEPAGFSVLTERAFSSVREDGWDYRYRVEGSYYLEADSSAPRSGQSVGVQRFEAPLEAGEPTIVWRNFPESSWVDSMYVSVWIKLSEGWQGHDSGVNKLFFGRIGDVNSYTRFFMTAFGQGDGPLTLQAWTQGTPLGDQLVVRPNLGASGRLTRGVWHQIELLLVANTGNNYDGQIHVWLDNTKISEDLAVIWTSPGEPQLWRGFEWTPVWGGVGSRPLAAPQFMSIDHIYISGR